MARTCWGDVLRGRAVELGHLRLVLDEQTERRCRAGSWPHPSLNLYGRLTGCACHRQTVTLNSPVFPDGCSLRLARHRPPPRRPSGTTPGGSTPRSPPDRRTAPPTRPHVGDAGHRREQSRVPGVAGDRRDDRGEVRGVRQRLGERLLAEQLVAAVRGGAAAGARGGTGLRPRARRGGPSTQSWHARPQSGHARPQSGHAKLQSGHAKPQSGHARPQSEHARPQSGHARPQSEHARPQSGSQHGLTAPSRAVSVLSRAVSVLSRAVPVPSRAVPVLSRAVSVPSRAVSVLSRAGSSLRAAAAVVRSRAGRPGRRRWAVRQACRWRRIASRSVRRSYSVSADRTPR